MNNRRHGYFIRKYVTWITAHPKSVIAVVGIITLLLITQLTSLYIEIDMDRQLPADHPYVVLGNRITDTFGGKFVAVIGIEVKEGDIYNQNTLSKVQRITSKVREIPGVIQSNVLSLSAINVKDIEGTPDGMKITRIMETLPTTEEEFRLLRERVTRNEIIDRLLVSGDNKMTTIIVDCGLVTKAGGFTGIFDRLNEIIEPEKDEHTIFRLAGTPINLYWMTEYSGRMKYVFPIALIVIGLLLFYAFRTIQGLVIPLSTAILSVVWSLAILGVSGLALDPYNIITPILILAIGAGHSVQILKRYYEEFEKTRDNRQAVIDSTTHVGAAMLTAGFVAAGGFASLVTFQTASIRAFGLLTAFGIIAALIIEMTFIPAIRTLMKAPDEEHLRKEQRRSVFDPVLENLSRWIIGGKGKIIIIIFTAIIIIAVWGITRLETNNTPTAFFTKGNQVITDLKTVNDKIAGAFVMQVLVEGKTEDALKDPQALRDMEALQNYAGTLPNVGKVVSLVDFVKMMNKAMHEDDPAYDVIPDSPELIAQYFLLYSMSGDPGDFDRVVDYDYQRAVMSLYVKKDSYADGKFLIEKINNFISTHLSDSELLMQPGGGIVNVVANSEVIIQGKVYNILQVCGIIFLFATIVFASFTGGFLVLLPLVISVLINLGVMGISGIWLSIATATISAMALGIGADYAIYFLFRFREELSKSGDWERALEIAETTSGKAILFVASSITLGYCCLMLSGFLPHVYLGILVPITMIVTSVGTLTILPSIILLVKPKFLSRNIIKVKEETHEVYDEIHI
jgi:uncharacterized protein